MSISGGNIYRDLNEKQTPVTGHKISAFIAVVLMGLLLSLIFINNVNLKREMTAFPEFSQAIERGDYQEALQMYRVIHDRVVAADASESDKYEQDREVMAQMEELVDSKLRTIENLMRTERYELSSEDILFMNEMEELTSSQISGWLSDLCEEFLLGTIEKPDVIFIFDQMSDIGNISASATPLLKEIETIEMARGDVQTAESEYNQGNYIQAVQIYQDVTENYEGFVYDFSVSRVTDIKDVMYEPMLEEGEHMLQRFMFYSAETLLSDMAVIFPDDERINADLIEATSHTQPCEVYRGSVEVLCVRQLVADTTRIYADNYVGSDKGLYLTTSEFSNMLQELYENDYVLVDAETLADLSSDTFIIEQDLVVPVGKKPLILVIENLDYSAYTYNKGLCSRLVLNEQGQVCGEYEDVNGDTFIDRGAEAIGILDAFVEQHNDFSYNGAKGVISICGYESCFGYVVSEDEEDDRNTALGAMGRHSVDFSDTDIENNRAVVSEIMDVLEDTGWKIASSTYGNINAYDADMDEIVSDTEKWMDQIGSLTDGVHMIVYPGGNYIYGTDPKAEYLKENGFRIFFGIGSNPYYIYGSNYLYYDRAIISPDSLMNIDYSRLFDADDILDPERTGETTEPEES